MFPNILYRPNQGLHAKRACHSPGWVIISPYCSSIDQARQNLVRSQPQAFQKQMYLSRLSTFSAGRSTSWTHLYLSTRLDIRPCLAMLSDSMHCCCERNRVHVTGALCPPDYDWCSTVRASRGHGCTLHRHANSLTVTENKASVPSLRWSVDVLNRRCWPACSQTKAAHRNLHVTSTKECTSCD